MGETSALLCIIGAVILIGTGVGSWRTMAGCLAGSLAMALILDGISSDTNPMFDIPFYWHWVLGGFAFAIVFMATDPVSSAFTNNGKLIYGLGIGVLGILIRSLNPAYPEGWMLAILFMNMFAPLIDHFIVEANIKRREVRYAAE
jgi:Na+-transporting NADH:ubiquinone oxidoreductase subunit B